MVASSPAVIKKPPSPNKHATGKSGFKIFAAMAAGMAKPIDDQPFVMISFSGKGVLHC